MWPFISGVQCHIPKIPRAKYKQTHSTIYSECYFLKGNDVNLTFNFLNGDSLKISRQSLIHKLPGVSFSTKNNPTVPKINMGGGNYEKLS